MTGFLAEPGVPSPLDPLAPLGPEAVAVAVTARPIGQTRWRLLLRRPTFVVGGCILLFWIVCAIFGHAIAPYSPLAQQLLGRGEDRGVRRLGAGGGRGLGSLRGAHAGEATHERAQNRTRCQPGTR